MYRRIQTSSKETTTIVASPPVMPHIRAVEPFLGLPTDWSISLKDNNWVTTLLYTILVFTILFTVTVPSTTLPILNWPDNFLF